MKKLITTITIALTLTFTTLYANNGYNYYYYGDGSTGDKLNKTAIVNIATQEVKRLTIEKKIPKSWRSMPISKIEKSNSNDWVVSFNNLKIKKKRKQILYIFVDIYGDIKGANYTGH